MKKCKAKIYKFHYKIYILKNVARFFSLVCSLLALLNLSRVKLLLKISLRVNYPSLRSRKTFKQFFIFTGLFHKVVSKDSFLDMLSNDTNLYSKGEATIRSVL